MKATTLAAFTALVLAGTACSESPVETAPIPVSAEDDGFNLPDYSTDAVAAPSSDSFNLGEPVLGETPASDGFNLSTPSVSGASIQAIPGLEDEDHEDVGSTIATDIDDPGLIRLDP